MRQMKKNPGMTGAFRVRLSHQHEVAVYGRIGWGCVPRKPSADRGPPFLPTRSAVGQGHLTAEQLALDLHHQVRAVELALVVGQAHVTLDIGQAHQNTPGSV